MPVRHFYFMGYLPASGEIQRNLKQNLRHFGSILHGTQQFFRFQSIQSGGRCIHSHHHGKRVYPHLFHGVYSAQRHIIVVSNDRLNGTAEFFTTTASFSQAPIRDLRISSKLLQAGPTPAVYSTPSSLCARLRSRSNSPSKGYTFHALSQSATVSLYKAVRTGQSKFSP